MNIKRELDDDICPTSDSCVTMCLRNIKSEIETQLPLFEEKIFPIKSEETRDAEPYNKQTTSQINCKINDGQWQTSKENILETTLSVKTEDSGIAGCSYSEETSCSQITPLSNFVNINSSNLMLKKSEPHFEIQVDEIDIEYERESTDRRQRLTTNSIENISDNCINPNIFLTNLEAVVKLDKIVLYEKNFVCGICFKIFPSLYEQNLHKLVHNQCIYNNNNMCNLYDDLKMHKKSPNEEKLYKCDECFYTCSRSSHMKLHQMTHSGEKPLKCDQCDFKCIQYCNLKKHKLTHTGEKPYKCENCNFKCVKYSDLKQHRVTHYSEKPFSCDECDYIAGCSSHLIRHKMTHSGEKPYKCEECDYKCTRSSDLKIHKYFHSGEKPFKCDVCQYTCSRSCDLKRHKMSHSGEKPFKCEKCAFSCSQSSYLKTHKMIHSGERPYKCEICDYSFTTSSNLKVHKLIHTRTEEKSLKCDVCNYVCSKKIHLDEHKRYHK